MPKVDCSACTLNKLNTIARVLVVHVRGGTTRGFSVCIEWVCMLRHGLLLHVHQWHLEWSSLVYGHVDATMNL